MYRALIPLLTFQFTIIKILFKSKNNLVLETIELRQQLMIYQTKKEDSKNITDLTRSLLVALKRAWPKWVDALIIVKPDDPDNTKGKRQQWKVFLKNHRQYIMGMDFFTVPTIRFKTLYVFFIIDHARRKIVHFNVTEHPTAEWVVQQLKNAFPFDSAPKYLICDRDSIFSARVKQFIKDIGVKPKVINYKCPWQNGVAERFVLSVQNDMLNQIIIFNEDQLRDVMSQYFKYYNNERCHLSVGRDSPIGREIQNKPYKSAKIISFPRIGGLHHVYKWDKAA